MSDSLATFVDALTHEEALRVESDLGNGFVRLRVSEAQRRQAAQDIRCVEDAVIEMLRNARDAGARALFLATAKAGSLRKIVMVDNGVGIPEHLLEAVFEPRVTSKLDTLRNDEWGVHGRGMALYSIKENAAYASAVASVEGQGCAFAVGFDVGCITERRDQSTLSPLVKGACGAWTVGAGPHNIARITEEFALAHRRECTVYFGSPVEIAATLYAFGMQTLKPAARSGAKPQDTAPAKRLALATDANAFAEIAASLGLSLSARSAYRIMQGEIAPLAPFLDTLPREGVPDAPTARKPVNLARDFRGLKIAPEDQEEFSVALKRAYAELAQRYYLEPDVEPKFRMSPEGIHVTFPVCKQ